MKRFLWAIPMLFLLMSGSAFATSINTFIGLVPNCCGENFSAFQTGGGFTLRIVGGVTPSFFAFEGYLPGTGLGGQTDLFFCCGFLQMGGNGYDLSNAVLGTLFLTPFTLPTNGRDSITFPVEIDFAMPLIITDTGQPFDASGSAKGHITFFLSPFDGLYYAEPFVQAPEPGTLGLMGTGLISILALVRKRLEPLKHIRSTWT